MVSLEKKKKNERGSAFVFCIYTGVKNIPKDTSNPNFPLEITFGTFSHRIWFAPSGRSAA